ncbi:MAG: acetate/propionate family kinase [Acetivibrionales bacterium]|jgi:acetate kinase
MKVLISNVGSTSLKFKLYGMPEEKVFCEAKIERVGSTTDAIYYYKNTETGYTVQKDKMSIPSYTDGIKTFLSSMTSAETKVIDDIHDIEAIGFKTVLAKGYYGVHELSEDVMGAMKAYQFVAPAHNGPYLEAIEQFKAVLPQTKMVGVFETAFHSTIPLERRIYALPYEWYEKYGIMRMGYHGASHSYVANQAAKDPGPSERIISCHLGGSCSICAIEKGKSVDCSFGFSLQTGIPHANRSGDADPYIIPFLHNEGLEMDEIMKGFDKRGGLLGVSGVSSDMREIKSAAETGNKRAKLAIDMFVCNIVRYIGAFYAELGGLDKLVFTGGIGEKSALIRALVCRSLRNMGVGLDEQINMETIGTGCISKHESKIRVLVISANEELGVARETYKCIFDQKNQMNIFNYSDS